VHVFISYRRSDAPSAARQLAATLKERLGEDHAFLDTRDTTPGIDWRSNAVRRVQEASIVLAVMGPHWLAATNERLHRTLLDATAEDVMRLEIETAFRTGATVVPVLVDDAEMPPPDAMPRSFRPLAKRQAQTLHHATWERDVEMLLAFLDGLADRAPPPEAPSVRPAEGPSRNPRSDAARVARHLMRGSVVTVLGSGVNAVDRAEPWRQGGGSLPDNVELARHLASHFGVGSEGDDLARISEHVSLTEGRIDLCRAVRELLMKVEDRPSTVHRFLAHLPRRIQALDREGHQLIVTTSYDTALERAFDAVDEPYDLAVFAATGEHKGRFMHVPWWDRDNGGPTPITVPNEYVDLPIDEEGALARTVIVKLHGGAIDCGTGGPNPRDNFVITEDDYIGYLTQGPIASLIPLQILNKLRESHFLFLRYRLRDWTLRVFLQRVWGEQKLEARSWAIDPEQEAVERELWDHLGVNVVEQSMADFLDELERELGAAGAHVER
jgi:SIR2-like domain/TIR domain